MASTGTHVYSYYGSYFGDGLSVLEYWYFRHEQTSGDVRDKVHDALLVAHGEFQKKDQSIDDACKIVRHFAKRAVDLGVLVTYKQTVAKIIRTIIATRPSLSISRTGSTGTGAASL